MNEVRGRFVVYVWLGSHNEGPDPYVYGPFQTKREACTWAEETILGNRSRMPNVLYNWRVAQYIDINPSTK